MALRTLKLPLGGRRSETALKVSILSDLLPSETLIFRREPIHIQDACYCLFNPKFYVIEYASLQTQGQNILKQKVKIYTFLYACYT